MPRVKNKTNMKVTNIKKEPEEHVGIDPSLPNNPYESFVPSSVQPCVVGPDGSYALHLLSCGHLVGVCQGSTHCAQNCLHVHNSAGIGHFAFINFIDRDYLFCPICFKQPFPIWQVTDPNSPLQGWMRTAISFNRKHFDRLVPGLEAGQLEIGERGGLMAPLYKEPKNDGKQPHRLQCGHVVYTVPVRPCAANCTMIKPRCRDHKIPGNRIQADAIVCAECTFSADAVEGSGPPMDTNESA